MQKRLPDGTVLQNRYKIIRELGAGGMGAVYEAWDEHTDAYVALKETFATDAKLISAFEREANLLANLSHEAFPRVMDYFAEKKSYFLVMELICGKDLAEMLKENGKPFDVETVLNWADQILDALEDLHSNKTDPIFHCDIKPENIKLTPRGKIKLIDFGLAQGRAGDLTKVKAMVDAGSQKYAPIEQLLKYDENAIKILDTGFSEKTTEFKDQELNATADLFALGTTLYELLTDSEPEVSHIRALKVWSGKPDNLKLAHELNSEVPIEISEILRQAMAIERKNRISTASEMRKSLFNWRKNVLENKRQAEIQYLHTQIQRLQDEVKVEKNRQLEQEIKLKTDAQKSFAELEKKHQAEIQRLQDAVEESQKKEVEKNRQLEQEREARQAEQKNIAELEKQLKDYSKSKLSSLDKVFNPFVERQISEIAKTTKVDRAESRTLPSISRSTNQQILKKSIEMEFVKIPAGTFLMGSLANEKDGYNEETLPQITISKGFYLELSGYDKANEKDGYNEETLPQVTISKDFYMGKYQVTQSQWKALMPDNPSRFKGDNLPVERVSWEDTQEFIEKLNAKGEGKYRLPTETEWEYACRAGTETRYYWGDDIEEKEIGKYAWYLKNSDHKTHEVGLKLPNKFGLYDMSGNVWEWCNDWFRKYPSGAVTDPSGATSGRDRVCRGGGWSSYKRGLRCVDRSYNAPEYRHGSLGFRLIRE